MEQQSGLRFGHIGLFVTDIERQAAFYKDYLGFTETDRGSLEGAHGPVQLVFLSRDPDEHHQIVMVSGRPEQIDFNVINQISLRADTLQTLKDFYQRLQNAPVTEISPITHGNTISVYFKDPEGNRVELYVNTAWYVDQPCRIPAPFDLPTDELMAWVERHSRTLPGFRPRSEWRKEMARRMGMENS